MNRLSQLRSLLLKGLLPLTLVSVVSPARADNHWYDDVTTEWSLMNIRRIELGGEYRAPQFYRHQLHLSIGRGRSSYGVLFQRASRENGPERGANEQGLMLTAQHEKILSQKFRVEFGAKLGITGTDEYQPLYTEDTDARLHLVWFDADGTGLLDGQPTFPSAYFGTIVNRFGRVQAVAGAGTWWRGLGIYGTGFTAFNGDGVDSTTDLTTVNFANLRNAGVSLSVSYQWRRFSFRVKQNHAIDNGSDDITFGVSYRHISPRRVDN